MKKIITISIAILIGSSAIAQRSSVGMPVEKFTGPSTVQTQFPPYDTLWGDFFLGTPTLYDDLGGGYVSGNNSFGDKSKAQAFIFTAPYKVVGTMLWFKGKKYVSGNGTSGIDVNLYNMNGTGTSTKGTANAPGTILTTKKLLISAIDTVQKKMNVVLFTTPVLISADYAVGINTTGLASGDFVGLISTLDGDAGFTELAWEQWSSNNWFTIADTVNTWGLDIDLGIFPIIDQNIGFEEMDFINGIKLSVPSPNPVVETAVIEYEIQQQEEVILSLFDISGKLLVNMNEGIRSQGKHKIIVDVKNLPAGSYFYSLQCGSKRVVKQMIVE